MVEAKFYTKLEDGDCRCDTCPRACFIKPGKRGYCLSRSNVDGKLISSLYGKVAAINTDPIEKKPLYHFMPGTDILSIGTIGCNLGCKFCQNWHLSRGKASTENISPDQIIRSALESGSKGIAYTYNEPLVWYEFVYDCCVLAREKGVKNVFVTNGSLNPEPFDHLLPYIDAMNIDLKGDAGFYERMTDSPIEPVKRNIQAAGGKTHIEITNLLVSGENDSTDQVSELVDFIASINPQIPVHFSRYFPNYKHNAPPTKTATFDMVHAIAADRLEFVYFGNIRHEKGRNTLCPECGALNIERAGYYTNVQSVDTSGNCGVCGFDLNIKVS